MEGNYTSLFDEIKSIGAQTGTKAEHCAHSLHLIDLKHFQWTNTCAENQTIGQIYTESKHLGEYKFSTIAIKCTPYESYWTNMTSTHIQYDL